MNAKSYQARKNKLSPSHHAVMTGGNKPAKEFDGFHYMEEIHHRAETMTPLLKEILAFYPQPQWHQ